MRLLYLIGLGIMSWASLAVGNFMYQSMNDHCYGVAAERSFFQLVAIAVFIVQIRLFKDFEPKD